MTDGDELPYPSKEQVRQIFQCAFGSGAVMLTKHARERMSGYGLTTNDLISLSKSGIVRSEPEQDIKTGELKYRIESSRLKMKAVFIVYGKKVRILTVMAD